MKSVGLFVSIITTSLFVSSLNAQTPADKTEPPALSKETKEKLGAIIAEVQQLHAKQHFVQAMQKLNEADALAPNNPMLANVRGSIYTAMRDFLKAHECFENAASQSPDAFEPKFNLAELLYVEQKYAEAEAAFTGILAAFPKLREEVRHLTQFKIIVCQLKQDKNGDAEKGMNAFTSMDDTPAYFYCKAATAFQKKDKVDGQSWLDKAMRIFKPQQNAIYIDTLVEAQWITGLTGHNDLGTPPKTVR